MRGSGPKLSSKSGRTRFQTAPTNSPSRCDRQQIPSPHRRFSKTIRRSVALACPPRWLRFGRLLQQSSEIPGLRAELGLQNRDYQSVEVMTEETRGRSYTKSEPRKRGSLISMLEFTLCSPSQTCTIPLLHRRKLRRRKTTEKERSQSELPAHLSRLPEPKSMPTTPRLCSLGRVSSTDTPGTLPGTDTEEETPTSSARLPASVLNRRARHFLATQHHLPSRSPSPAPYQQGTFPGPLSIPTPPKANPPPRPEPGLGCGPSPQIFVRRPSFHPGLPYVGVQTVRMISEEAGLSGPSQEELLTPTEQHPPDETKEAIRMVTESTSIDSIVLGLDPNRHFRAEYDWGPPISCELKQKPQFLIYNVSWILSAVRNPLGFGIIISS